MLLNLNSEGSMPMFIGIFIIELSFSVVLSNSKLSEISSH